MLSIFSMGPRVREDDVKSRDLTFQFTTSAAVPYPTRRCAKAAVRRLATHAEHIQYGSLRVYEDGAGKNANQMS